MLLRELINVQIINIKLHIHQLICSVKHAQAFFLNRITAKSHLDITKTKTIKIIIFSVL